MSLNYQFKNSCGNPGFKYHYNEWRETNIVKFDIHNGQPWKKARKKLCSNASFQMHEHLTTQINCNCFFKSQFYIVLQFGSFIAKLWNTE